MLPTPTASGRAVRPGDFANLVEALDYAARQRTGINILGPRGELAEVMPYGRLREEAVALAGRMLAAGLAPGDRVALAAESDGDFLRAFFACQYAGLAPAPTPLPAPFAGKEVFVAHIRRLLIAAGARAAFCPPALAVWFAEAAEDLPLVANGPIANLPTSAAGADLPVAGGPDSLCYLQFSSGSTRFPLGVAVTHAALMANLATVGRHGLCVMPEDRTVSWLPLYHDMGLVGMLLNSLAFQVSVDLIPTSAFIRRPGLWLDTLSERRGSISYAPTFGYELAARRGATRDRDLSAWRVAGIGGDMIRPDPLDAFAEAFAPAGFRREAFVASYGMAEATLALSLSPLDRGLVTDPVALDRLETDHVAEAPSVAAGGDRIRRFALCGRPIAGHAIEPRDAAGQPLGERRVGRLFARGPSLMREYFGEPEETARVLSADGWLDTGDLGYLLNGEVVITGRAKDLIIVHGRNVWPQDLEWTAEAETPGLRPGDVAVFSVAEEIGEQVVAVVQCRAGDPAAREALRNQVATAIRLRHGLEARVALAPPHGLPRTSSGKLSRSRARSLYLAGAFAEAAERVSA